MALQAAAADISLLSLIGDLFRHNNDCSPRAFTSFTWIYSRTWGVLLSLHAAACSLLYKRDQHLRRDQRNRSQPELSNSISCAYTQLNRNLNSGNDNKLQRRDLPSTLSECFADSTIFTQYSGPNQVQQVPVQGLCRGYILLLRRNDLRSVRYSGSLLKNPAFVLHSSNHQLPYFPSSAFWDF